MRWRAPRYLTSHPAVAKVEDGEAEGSDYRHEVELKPGWRFTGGRHRDLVWGFFNNKADFDYANPQKEK